jgi:hypothetical protein
MNCGVHNWNPTLANQDLHGCKSGFAYFGLHDEIDRVEVGLALTAALDFDETAFLEFGDGTAHRRYMRAHVLGQAFLAGEAKVVVPRVTEQERVSGLRVGRKIRIAQNKIGELREAVQRDRVGAVETHVLLNLLEIGPDVIHAFSIRWR